MNSSLFIPFSSLFVVRDATQISDKVLVSEIERESNISINAMVKYKLMRGCTVAGRLSGRWSWTRSCDRRLRVLAVYKKMEDAMKKHPDADNLVSFASLRSAYESTMEAMKFPQV